MSAFYTFILSTISGQLDHPGGWMQYALEILSWVSLLFCFLSLLGICIYHIGNWLFSSFWYVWSAMVTGFKFKIKQNWQWSSAQKTFACYWRAVHNWRPRSHEVKYVYQSSYLGNFSLILAQVEVRQTLQINKHPIFFPFVVSQAVKTCFKLKLKNN